MIALKNQFNLIVNFHFVNCNGDNNAEWIEKKHYTSAYQSSGWPICLHFSTWQHSKGTRSSFGQAFMLYQSL